MVRVLLALSLVTHGYLTAKSWSSFGYIGFFPPFEDANTLQIFSDLAISVTLLHGAIALDLQRRGEPRWWNLPLMVGTALSGSFTAMGYFMLRPQLLELALRGDPIPNAKQDTPRSQAR